MARSVLAQCARSLPLPLAAQDEIANCLEWFKNVPATNKVLLELCNNPVCDYELLVHAVAPDARIVLQWLCQEGARRRMYLGVSINWQRWIAPSAPWSVDLQALPHTNGHVEGVWGWRGGARTCALQAYKSAWPGQRRLGRRLCWGRARAARRGT